MNGEIIAIAAQNATRKSHAMESWQAVFAMNYVTAMIIMKTSMSNNQPAAMR